MKQKAKKSILGLNTIKAFIVVLLSLAIIGIVTIIVLSSIQNAGLVTTDVVSGQVNATIGNVSGGIASFFANAGTYFALLGVVVIILIISLVVVVVNRFGGDNSQGAL
jgi:hypothetical protein